MVSGLHTRELPTERFFLLVKSLGLPDTTTSLTFNSNGDIVFTIANTDDDW